MQDTTQSQFINFETSRHKNYGVNALNLSTVSFSRCQFNQNGTSGMQIRDITGTENIITKCGFKSNVSYALDIKADNQNAENIKILGNGFKNNNSGAGNPAILISENSGISSNIIFSNNILNGTDATAGIGIEITGGSFNVISNNVILGYTTPVKLGDRDNIVTGNRFKVGNVLLSGTNGLINTVTGNFISNTLGTLSESFEQEVFYMKNTSGGSLALGDIVVLKSVATMIEVTTTTTQGDDKGFGMIMETIANNTFGAILKNGVTTNLKVDGTTDIAVGDFIGTFTTAKIGMKAATGDMAIAIAREAYTTDDSSGVIDALFITPRKI